MKKCPAAAENPAASKQSSCAGCIGWKPNNSHGTAQRHEKPKKNNTMTGLTLRPPSARTAV